MVEGAANAILKKAGEDRVVGHNWAYRFITRLPPGFNYITQHPKEKSRVDSEDYGALLLWFNNLTQVMKHHQFLPHEIFNWDETGYRIGKGKARNVRLLPRVQPVILLPEASRNELWVLNVSLPMAG